LSNLVLVVLIVFVAVPLPLFIVLHFITKWKQVREISGGDEKMLQDLWRLSQRMEDRLDALETILDNQPQNWRRIP